MFDIVHPKSLFEPFFALCVSEGLPRFVHFMFSSFRAVCGDG